MSLEVRVGGSKRRVELRREGNRYLGRVGERQVEAEVVERGPASLLIRLGDRTFDITCDTRGSRHFLDFGTQQVAIEILDPLRGGEASLDGEASGKADVRAAMPGKVVSVKAKVGDTVSRGQGLLVLEAMKMENEVPAPRAGTITAIEVAAGQTVETGALLATVE
ncbi:MAG TPA: biotin/lipoyl-containing protein [Candidatus Polarisedimenticolia bacterium]|nr:biotin/lipoyl-containing protein [Candidatus Polarisedimenticolia bacterium]